ncbi:MAG: glycerol-3-phosphate dehydrogenase [Pseudomonadota bacterium]
MYDLLVIGGGINGAGIARDAAGRGLKVLLCEKDDLASHTSSASTKLIHGGLRYLENYDFGLVRKALIEREVLLQMAPHIIWPMRFVLPQDRNIRSPWLVRLGLFLYDNLGGRKILPGTKVLHRSKSRHLSPLSTKYKKAFEYSDCWVEDSRLVVLNAVDAAERGADIKTRTKCIGLRAESGAWQANLENDDGTRTEVTAKAVVNAAGPWVDNVTGLASQRSNSDHVRLVKGSHIIVNSHFEGDQAYIFQNEDERIIFAIPYENGNFTLIGTTDEAFEGDPQSADISQGEIDYLCDSVNKYFQKNIAAGDVVATYSGVRPLYDDKSDNVSAVTRDYVLTHIEADEATLISVYGGKITTYRKLAEDVMDELTDIFPTSNKKWTKTAPLPGGDIPNADFEAFNKPVSEKYSWMDQDTLHRLIRAYGTRVDQIIGTATSVDNLGTHYGGGLYQAEIDYLQQNEFARTAMDVLYRRSKLYLHISADQQAALAAAMENGN